MGQNITKEVLEELYLNQKKSADSIAKELESYKKAIQRLLVLYNIPIRTAGLSRSIYLKNNPDKNPLVKLNKERSEHKIISKPKNNIFKSLIIDLDTVSYTIEDYKTKKGNIVKTIYYIENNQKYYIDIVLGKVSFTCKDCNKKKEMYIHYFIQNNYDFTCRECHRNKTRKENNWKMPESSKKLLSDQRKGVEKIDDFFDFTCPVCGKTFSYRNLHRNRIKKYCSKECQLTVWIQAPRYDGTMNNLEKYFASILDEMNIFYLPQHQIGFYFVDFYLPKYNLIILVDGDYWHVNLNVHPEGVTSEAQENNLSNDKRFESYIKQKTEYKLFRIWEEEINSKSKEEIKLIIENQF